jgi:transcriptional regulator with XRE-family HTH domain
MSQSISMRQAAHEAGVSPATSSRVLQGDHIRDYGNLLLLAQWAGIALDELEAGHDMPGQLHIRGEATPEAFARVLRADSSLSPEDVETIMASFRPIYDRFSKSHIEQRKGKSRSISVQAKK